MLETFLGTLNPMLTLFLCMAIGYAIRKTNIVGDDASKVVAKLETNVFCVALSVSSMAKNFTIERIMPNLVNIALSSILLGLCVITAIILSKIFVKKECYERFVYRYAFAFANYGYVGDPLVLMLFGDVGFFYYKMLVIPISIICLSWGVGSLISTGRTIKDKIKGIFNPPMIGLFVGMIIGVTGLGNIIYTTSECAFLANTLDTLSACMGPFAMILAGITVARFSLLNMIKEKKVYLASIVRLVFLPAFLMAVIFGIKQLINFIFGVNIDNSVLYLMFFVVAMPFGMNTIVYPEAYGGDPSKGASMTLISHTLCVITIPLMFALLCLIFGPAPVF